MCAHTWLNFAVKYNPAFGAHFEISFQFPAWGRVYSGDWQRVCAQNLFWTSGVDSGHCCEGAGGKQHWCWSNYCWSVNWIWSHWLQSHDTYSTDLYSGRACLYKIKYFVLYNMKKTLSQSLWSFVFHFIWMNKCFTVLWFLHLQISNRSWLCARSY